MLEIPRQRSRVAPDLRRAAVSEDAAETLSAGTGLTLMAPEEVTRTDEPVFVSHVELEPVSGGKNGGTAHQGHVVKGDYIEAPGVQSPPNRPSMNEWPARLMREQEREPPEATVQANDLNAILRISSGRLIAPAQHPVRIDILDHCHFVAATHESLR